MLLLSGMSVAGMGLAASLAELRLPLVALSALFLGLGFYFAYWKRWGSKWHRSLLWAATVLNLIFWVLPDLLPYLAELLMGEAPTE